MRKVLSIAMVAFMFAGSAALACDCGCATKKAETKKPACSSSACEKADKADCKKCTKEKTCKGCIAKKAACDKAKAAK